MTSKLLDVLLAVICEYVGCDEFYMFIIGIV